MPITKTTLCTCGRELWPSGVGNGLACVCGKSLSPSPITWTLADLRRDAEEFNIPGFELHSDQGEKVVDAFLTYLTATYGEFVPVRQDLPHAP